MRSLSILSPPRPGSTGGPSTGFEAGPCSEKCGARHLGRQTLFFLGKNWRPFLVITVAFIHFTRSLWCRPLLPACKKIAAPLVGPLFVRPLFSQTCWTCLNPPLGWRHAQRHTDTQTSRQLLDWLYRGRSQDFTLRGPQKLSAEAYSLRGCTLLSKKLTTFFYSSPSKIELGSIFLAYLTPTEHFWICGP